VAIVSRDPRACFLGHFDGDDQRRGIAHGFLWSVRQGERTPEDVLRRVRGEVRGRYELEGRSDPFFRHLIDALDRHRADALLFAGFCLECRGRPTFEQHGRRDWRVLA
jgi:hypothetical protein